MRGKLRVLSELGVISRKEIFSTVHFSLTTVNRTNDTSERFMKGRTRRSHDDRVTIFVDKKSSFFTHQIPPTTHTPHANSSKSEGIKCEKTDGSSQNGSMVS